MAENIARRLGESGRHDARGTLAIIRGAALDMQRPVFISVSLIMVAFLPLLSLTRIEGLLFRPMALTILFALLGGLIFALVLVPVLASFLFRHGYHEWENPLLRWFTPLYAWAIRGLLNVRWLVATASIAGLALVLAVLVPRLGTEFLPYLDEGVLWVRANFPEGTSLEQTSEYGHRLREMALGVHRREVCHRAGGPQRRWHRPLPAQPDRDDDRPEAARTMDAISDETRVDRRAGGTLPREIPDDPVQLHPADHRQRYRGYQRHVCELGGRIQRPRFRVLLGLARQTVELLKRIRGATDVSIEQEGPQPQLLIQPDRAPARATTSASRT